MQINVANDCLINDFYLISTFKKCVNDLTNVYIPMEGH